MAVAGIPAGHHAVKQIDTTGNRLNDVAWGANAHQVTDLILGHIGLYFADHLVHDLGGLTHGQAADGITVQIHFCNLLHMLYTHRCSPG